MKQFFVRQARRPDHASSAAIIINSAKASKSNMVTPADGWKNAKRFRFGACSVTAVTSSPPTVSKA
jgi:hypothetical protein